MTRYIRKSNEKNIIYAANEGNEDPLFTIMDVNEFRNNSGFHHSKEILHSLGSVRYCKAEVFSNCIWGTLLIPPKGEVCNDSISFGFYMTDKSLIFIEDSGDLKKWIDKRIKRFENVYAFNQILLKVIELMTENDVLYLIHLEKEIENLETSLDNNITKDFFSVLTKHRRKLSQLRAYYEQLTAMGDSIQSQECLSIVENVEPWNRFVLRTERLQNHVSLLQENVLQLRELYNSRQNERQNNIMCILTVVTTLFLPLTLLTGWYGMNFKFMPELNWKYGYLAVIIAAVTIVILEIIYFKRKKFF